MDYRHDKGGAIEHVGVEGAIDGISWGNRWLWNCLNSCSLNLAIYSYSIWEGPKNSSPSFWRVWCLALLPLNCVQVCPRVGDSHLLVSPHPIPVTHAILIVKWSSNGASWYTAVSHWVWLMSIFFQIKCHQFVFSGRAQHLKQEMSIWTNYRFFLRC